MAIAARANIKECAFGACEVLCDEEEAILGEQNFEVYLRRIPIIPPLQSRRQFK